MPLMCIQRKANLNPPALFLLLFPPRRRPRLYSMPRAGPSRSSYVAPGSLDLRESDEGSVRDEQQQDVPREHLPRDSPNNPFALEGSGDEKQ